MSRVITPGLMPALSSCLRLTTPFWPDAIVAQTRALQQRRPLAPPQLSLHVFASPQTERAVLERSSLEIDVLTVKSAQSARIHPLPPGATPRTTHLAADEPDVPLAVGLSGALGDVVH